MSDIFLFFLETESGISLKLSPLEPNTIFFENK